MPGGTENLMYSFNLGPVHFIALSTEAYYFLRYGIKTLVKQYEWLEADLIEATKPENRSVCRGVTASNKSFNVSLIQLYI